MVTTCESSLASVAPVEAIYFDIDGTLCDSDPIRFLSFQQMLQEVGFNGGVPISEEFFITQISGKHNDNIGPVLFPDWDVQKTRQFLDDKEALFRKLAAKEIKQVEGLDKLCKWITVCGLKHATVTNAPRSNAELLLSMLGLAEFFETFVIGTDWGRPKQCPDAYLKGLEMLYASHKHAFIFEDSVSGIKAVIAAGMPVVGVALRNPAGLLEEAGAVFTTFQNTSPGPRMSQWDADPGAKYTTLTLPSFPSQHSKSAEVKLFVQTHDTFLFAITVTVQFKKSNMANLCKCCCDAFHTPFHISTLPKRRILKADIISYLD